MRVRSGRLVILFGGRGNRVGIIERLYECGYTIERVVVPATVSSSLLDSANRLASLGLCVVSVRRDELDGALTGYRGRTLLSVSFPYLLPEHILQEFDTCLNVHPTLLPKYRGPTSGAYILMNREPATGSTVHIMDAGMDTGPIVLQRAVELSRFDTIRSMQRKVFAMEPDLVADALRLLAEPRFRPEAQDEAAATVFPKKRTPADSLLDAGRPLAELYDHVRACDFDEFPAFFFVDGQKVCVRMWRPERPAEDGDDTI